MARRIYVREIGQRCGAVRFQGGVLIKHLMREGDEISDF